MDVLGWNMSAGTIGLMTGDVMIACSQGNAHLLGEVISMKHPQSCCCFPFCSWETLESSGPVDGSHGDGWHGVCGGDKERDVQSTASLLNEIGVGGLSVEVATDNEAALKSLLKEILQQVQHEAITGETFQRQDPGKRHRESCLHYERRDLCQ